MATPTIAPAATGAAGPHTDPADEAVARKRARRDGWARRGPLLPALIFTIIVTQLPFVITIWYSLQNYNLLQTEGSSFAWFSNYLDIFRDSTFRHAAFNSILFTLACVVVAMVLGIAFALLLDRPFRGRGIVRTLLITPLLVMPVAGALLWSVSMLDPTYGLFNWTIGLVGIDPVDWTSSHPVVSVLFSLVWQWTPFMMLLVLAGLQSQPTDVLEAAKMDGASKFQTFLFITLPQLRRYIELGVLLGCIYVVNTFDQIYLMTSGGPGTASSNLPFYIYQRAFLGFDIGQSSAMGVIVVVATIIVATLALRLIFRSFDSKEA